MIARLNCGWGVRGIHRFIEAAIEFGVGVGRVLFQPLCNRGILPGLLIGVLRGSRLVIGSAATLLLRRCLAKARHCDLHCEFA